MATVKERAELVSVSMTMGQDILKLVKIHLDEIQDDRRPYVLMSALGGVMMVICQGDNKAFKELISGLCNPVGLDVAFEENEHINEMESWREYIRSLLGGICRH